MSASANFTSLVNILGRLGCEQNKGGFFSFPILDSVGVLRESWLRMCLRLQFDGCLVVKLLARMVNEILIQDGYTWVHHFFLLICFYALISAFPLSF